MKFVIIGFLKKIKEYLIIRRSGLFDINYYLVNYPDVRQSDIDPLWHFVCFGWKEGRNPSNWFDIRCYLNLHPDMANTGINPFIHFIKHGRTEKRTLVPLNLSEVSDDIVRPSFEVLMYENAKHPPRSFDVIIFPFIDWTYRFQRPQQLATQLAKLGHRVFYIKTEFSETDYPIIEEIQHNIFSVQLSNKASTNKFNTNLCKQDIHNLINSFQILKNAFLLNSSIMLVDSPYWVNLVLKLKDHFGWKLVYDFMDLHSGFPIQDCQVQSDETELIWKSDLVVVSSHILRNHVQSIQNNRTILISNGTDFEFFHQAKSPILCDDLSEIPSPIIGYYGAIEDWFDISLIGSIARDYRSWSFVLIGSTILTDLDPLVGLENIYILGEKPYTEIPKYLSHFDVCIIPYKMTLITHATNPVEMYEYLSAGKPIVVTNLEENSYYAGFVRIAESKQEWVIAIENSLSEEKTQELLNKRYDFAKQNTWLMKAQTIRVEVSKLFPKISIIIVSYNNLNYTKLCLESIIKNTNYPNYEIIIVDNGSIEDTVIFLRDYCSKNNIGKLILNEFNLGFAKANNQGVQISDGDYLVLLNNDTIVSPGWIHQLLWHLSINKNIGMVGPVTNAIANEAKIDIDYVDASIDNVNKFAAKQTVTNYGQSFEIKVLALFCCMIPKDLYLEVDGLDERYQIGMFEDDDLSLKIKNKGLKLICAKDVFIHHVQRAAFKLFSDEKYLEIFYENKEKFEKKWNINWTQHSTERRNGNSHSSDDILDDLTFEEFQKKVISTISKYQGIFIQEPNIYWEIPLYQRPQHIATALGKLGYLVIYRIPSPKESGKGFRKVSENVWVTHLEVSNISNFVSSVYSTAFPSVDYIIGRKKRDDCIFVYEYIDHISPDISVDNKTVKKLEKMKEFAFKNADFIVASANQLEQESINKVGKDKVLYIPNGVDVEHYRDTKHQSIMLPQTLIEFRNRFKIIVGYFGAISPWLWYDMLIELINKRNDTGFLFIGPDYQDSIKKLPKSSNILHLGAVDYKILPGYAKVFDICFIPFAPGKIAESTSPLKLFEYFALEKPVVVSSFMKECIMYEEVFRGDSTTSISQAIDAAFKIKDDPIYKNKLSILAECNSWQHRAQEYSQIFKHHIK